MRIFPISLSYQALFAGRLSHPAANPLRLTLRMRDGESLAAPCVLRAELHTSRFIAANTTPLAVVTAAASPFQGEWNLDLTSAQMNQPTPPEGVRKLWLVVYATEGSTILYTFAGIDVDLGWHAISQVTPPPPFVPLVADVGGRGWQTDWQYEAETLVVNGTTPYVSLSAHTSSAATEPGAGPDWETVWQAAGGVAGVDWGDIGGSLSSQVDLMEALDAKQDTAALGTMSSQNANNVFITGGSISGLSSLGVIGGATFSATTAGSVSTSADILINGTRFGRGNGSISTNVFIGSAGASTLSGTAITCLGNGAGASMTSGGSNVAIGSSSLSLATTASQVVCVGSFSGNAITTQNGITAVGHSALGNLNSSTSSPAAVVAIGTNAGRFLANGSTSHTSAARSIFIGHSAYPLGDVQTNQIVIGDSAVGDGSNTTVIGRAATVTTRFAGTTTSAAIISGNELRIANSSTPAENAAGSIGAQRWDVNYQYVCTAINTTGAGITNAGTGGTNGTYRGVQLARVSGGTATEYPVVDIVISGTVVTSVTVVSGTAFSSAGNPIVMGLAAGQFAGGITGFQYTLETLTPTWKRIPLRSYSALIPISEGGTGAGTAAGARANLGIETVVTDATTARTLASADAASYIRFTSSSAITITIPTNATDPIPIGSEFFIRRAGTGAISLSNAGVTVNNSDIASLATGRVCRLKKVGTNEWDYIA